jgi:hypothetical protein
MTRLFGSSLWAVPASRNPKYRPGSGHEKTNRMSYLFEPGFPQNHTPAGPSGADTPKWGGSGVTF